MTQSRNEKQRRHGGGVAGDKLRRERYISSVTVLLEDFKPQGAALSMDVEQHDQFTHCIIEGDEFGTAHISL